MHISRQYDEGLQVAVHSAPEVVRKDPSSAPEIAPSSAPEFIPYGAVPEFGPIPVLFPDRSEFKEVGSYQKKGSFSTVEWTPVNGVTSHEQLPKRHQNLRLFVIWFVVMHIVLAAVVGGVVGSLEAKAHSKDPHASSASSTTSASGTFPILSSTGTTTTASPTGSSSASSETTLGGAHRSSSSIAGTTSSAVPASSHSTTSNLSPVSSSFSTVSSATTSSTITTSSSTSSSLPSTSPSPFSSAFSASNSSASSTSSGSSSAATTGATTINAMTAAGLNCPALNNTEYSTQTYSYTFRIACNVDYPVGVDSYGSVLISDVGIVNGTYTLDACIENCASNPECNAVTFNITDMSASEPVVGACVLKSSRAVLPVAAGGMVVSAYLEL